MKKNVRLFVSLMILVVLFSFCGKKEKAVSGVEGTLALLPKDVKGVMVVNAEKANSLDYFKETFKVENFLKENEKALKSYNEFTEKTGIDLKKDMKYIGMGFISEDNPCIVMNIAYDKSKLVSFMKEKAKEKRNKVIEETYNGITIYEPESKSDVKGEMAFSMLDNNFIAIAKPDTLKNTIDIYKGAGENILSNEKFTSLFGKVNQKSILWGVVDISEEMAKSLSNQSKSLGIDASKISALLVDFDYINNTLEGKIEILSADEQNNQKIVEMLNGFKAMLTMKDNEVSRLLQNVNFISSADSIKLDFSVPKEVLDDLKAKGQEKAKEFMKGGLPEKKI